MSHKSRVVYHNFLKPLFRSFSLSYTRQIAIALKTETSTIIRPTHQSFRSNSQSVSPRTKPPFEMWFTRGFSLTNFVIGTSALSFQVFVLYPWHEQLDEEFKELRKEHMRLLDETHKQHGLELRRIREQLDELKAQKSGWWR